MSLFETKDFLGPQSPFRSAIATTRGPPVFNEPSNISRSSLFFRNQPINYRELFYWIRKTPEAVGILNAIVTDIISDKFYFQVAKERRKGKGNVKRAKEFCDKNFFKQVLQAALFDWLATGDAYLWLGSISEVQIKEFMVNRLKVLRKKIEYKDISIKDIDIQEMKDHLINEDSLMEQIEHVATSTMNIMFDESKVTGYVQNVGMITRAWTPDQIIHSRLMMMNGKVHGFSPLVASWSSVTTLGLMKDYNSNFFSNGGVPDFMFIMKKEMAGSPNVLKLEQVLQEFKPSTQKRANLVFTGEVDIERLNDFQKDMEFQKLAIYHTGVLALAFNMPLDRVLTIVGAGVKGKSSDMTESGYWNQISAHQDYWENLLNNHLFVPFFGVKMRFRRQYLQNQVREAQTLTMKLDAVQKYFDLGIPVQDQYIFNLLGLTDEDLKEGKKIDREKMSDNNLMGQNQLNNMQVLSEPAKIQESSRKKAEADVQAKDMMLELRFPVFKTIVENWMKKTRDKTTRVHYFQTDDGRFVCYFSTPDWKYTCVVSEDELNDVDKNFVIKSGIKIENEWEKEGGLRQEDG